MTEFAPAIVGRSRELELLEHVLEDSSAGSPQLVLVTGEPGIGKTALLTELSRRADERGCLMLQGSAAEFEAELPFGLIVDALDEYLESLDPRAFNRLATEDLAELAGVFPALRSLDKGSDVPTTAAERYRAHRAVRDLIECLAVTQPLVLVLDDLHWADAASLELTSHLLRRPPRARMVLAIAFRAGQAQAVETTIAAACRGSKTVRRVSLGPLEPADAEALVDLPDQADRERLYRASGGNPFYLLELARIHGEGRHGSSSLDDDLDVPSAVMAAIGGELDRLSAPARCMAEAGAVVGDPFDLDLAVATASLAAADGLAAIDELTSCDLVRPANVPRRFLFRHPLVRRAAYESCAAGARLAAHERCADALAAQGAPAAMRAHHVQHAARHGDLAAIAVLRDAGQASAERAPASAARWFELALRLLPESASEEERVPLLMALAAALAATGRLEDSRAALLEGLAVMTDDEQEPRLKLIGMCASLEQRLGRHEEAHTRLVTALAPLSDSRSPHAVELMIHLAHGDLYRMDFDSMREWAERARSAAQSLENVPLAAASTALLAVADASSGAVSEARAHCSQAAARVDVLSDDELAHRLDALANLCTAELYLHRYDQAAVHAKRGLAIGRATGQADLSPVLIPVLANILHMWGKITESAELLDETIEAARLSGNVEGLGWGLLGQAFTAVAAGDIELALTAAKESVELTRALDDSLVSTNAGVALAHALYESGEPRRAIDTLLTSAGGEELSLLPDGWRANYFELLTRCWIALDRLDEAQQAAAHAHSTAASVRLPLADAMSHRASAAVALYQDDSRLAADQAAAAVAAADKIGARVDAAIARTLLGRALAGAGESERAVKELELATQQLDSCGAVRYRNQAEQELRKLGQHPYRRTRPQNADGVGVDTLTRREADIARLVTNRDTNSEIAAQLVLSVKTIESHMHNIFRKLDVSSRVEVARSVERAEAVQQAQAEQRADRQRHELGE